MTYLRLLFCLAVLCQPCRIYAVEPSHQERSEPGELKSPGYPRPYPKGAEDSWVFERPSGVWAVVFEDIDIEKSEACADDYLLVRDLTRSVNLVRTCGDRPPGPVYSYGNKLLISFHSDRLNEGRGFRLRVLHDVTTEALKARLVQPSTTAKHVPAEPVEFTKDDLMVLVLSLALLFALLVVFCLAGWILYQHCYRHGHSPCCACSRSSATSKQVTINMEPTVVARKAKSYTKQARPKDPPVDPSGYGHPNVYLPMPDSDTDQSLQSPSQRTGTDVTSSGQLPMYHTPQPAYMEEVKFIGVM